MDNTPGSIAEEIAYRSKDRYGKRHFEKHVGDFKKEKRGPVQKVNTEADYKNHIEKTLDDKSTVGFKATNDRDLYWNRRTNTFVSVNHKNPERSTCFRPSQREKYVFRKAFRQSREMQSTRIKRGGHAGLNREKVKSQPPRKNVVNKSQYKVTAARLAKLGRSEQGIYIGLRQKHPEFVKQNPTAARRLAKQARQGHQNQLAQKKTEQKKKTPEKAKTSVEKKKQTPEAKDKSHKPQTAEKQQASERNKHNSTTSSTSKPVDQSKGQSKQENSKRKVRRTPPPQQKPPTKGGRSK